VTETELETNETPRPGDVRIAAVTAADADALADMHASAFDDAWDRTAIAGILALPTTVALAAWEGDRAVGVVFLQAAGGEAEVLSVGVRPTLRRRGLGRRLLAAALCRLIAVGITQVTLEVAVDNEAARRLYAASGFVFAGWRPGYYRRDPAPAVDAAILRLDFFECHGRVP
jgi:ribosomal-protein-alanine N-acetyltransferase